MAKGLMGLVAKASPMEEPMDDEAEDIGGSAGEMAAEDFANAKTGAERYAAFKRMFKACEAESMMGGEAESDEESEY